MLNFFKINDPYRLAFIFLLMLLIRIPLFYTGIPIIIPELKWMLLGEAIADGKYMYKDIWDFTGPLASGAYSIIHMLFGKSVEAYRTISIILVVIQCGVFNNLLLKNKAYNQNTYIPALLYMLFMHISFDFLTLSPVLMGMTFTLLGINNLFQRMDNTTRDDLFVRIGLFLGIASLFYLPFFLYFIVINISLLIYTGSILRRIFLMIYGFSLVFILASLYYFWFDSFPLFRIEFLESVFNIEQFKYLTWPQFLGLSFIPLSIFIVSFFKVKTLGRYVNFQVKIQSVMLMFMVTGVISILISKELSVYQLIFIVPGLAFFVAHYLMLLKKWFFAEVIFMMITVLLLMNLLFPLKQWLFIDEFVSYDSLTVQDSPYDAITSEKTVLVLGDNVGIYKNSSLATPYLNWQFSKSHLENLNYYDNLTEVYQNFNNDLPEVIIDEKDIVPILFDKMPTVGLKYTQHYSMKNVYLKK